MAGIAGVRRCSCVFAAAYLTLVAVPQALGQETGPRDISGALLRVDQEAADEVIRTLCDPD